MTTPGFDGPIEDLAQVANIDGKIRVSGYENHMDLVAIMDQMVRKRRFKTGELADDSEREQENG